MWYNVENLFDTRDDPGTNDSEYLPGGMRGWSSRRMHEKLLKIAKVILSAGYPEPPEVVGLCEIENRYVLDRLLIYTPLGAAGYKIIHKESPDGRGIDVALLYREKAIYPLKYEYYRVSDEKDPVWTTRDILYFSCIPRGIDTLHLFFNHWPSRSSGILESTSKRQLAAKTLSDKVTELKHRVHDPKIIIMGDFNDQPEDASLSSFLKAGKIHGRINPEALYNLSYGWAGNSFGTHKFQSQWSLFDQVIVSGTLLSRSSVFFCYPEDAKIHHPEFLQQYDKTYGGIKPFRAYSGYKYAGGFSDHFPVFLDVRRK